MPVKSIINFKEFINGKITNDLIINNKNVVNIYIYRTTDE